MKRITLRNAIEDLPKLKPSKKKNKPAFESKETGYAIQLRDNSNYSDYVKKINHNEFNELIFNHKSRYNNERDIMIFSKLKEGENSLSDSISDIMPYKNRNHFF